MIEHLSLGPTPVDEPCQQAPYTNPTLALLECRLFRDQLLRQSPTPNGASLHIKVNDHEFGPYFDVIAVFDSANTTQTTWAYNLEADTPQYWDGLARVELEIFNAL